jgi:hypothetical protein
MKTQGESLWQGDHDPCGSLGEPRDRSEEHLIKILRPRRRAILEPDYLDMQLLFALGGEDINASFSVESPRGQAVALRRKTQSKGSFDISVSYGHLPPPLPKRD